MKTIKTFLLLLIFQSIVFSQNGWFHQNSGTQDPLLSVHFVNSEIGFICSIFGSFLKTTNGGNNWIQIFQDTMHFRSLYFFDTNKGYMLADEQYLYKTSNGGLNWSRSFFPTGIGFQKILFINEQTGFIVANYGEVFKTTNSGLSWNNNSISQSQLRDIFFVNQQTGYIAGYSTNIYKTTNQGVNWLSYPTGLTAFFNSIYFIDVNTGFVVGYSGKAAKTTNGGLLWDSINLNTRSLFYSVKFINNLTGFIGGGGRILKTMNGGNNWFPSFIDTVNNPQFYNMQFVNESTGYAVGHKPLGFSAGIILKTTNGGSAIGIQPLGAEIPNNFSLSQNYPNPFNPATIINFSVPVNCYVRLLVYDMIGREIEIIVNQELNAGTYKADWNASSYPSGVYYYQLTASDYTETKKMVLIK